MTKKDNEDFDNSAKYWIFDNAYFDGDVKVRDQCHATGKYRGSAHRDCNNIVKSQNSCRISQPKKLWFTSYYARTSQI